MKKARNSRKTILVVEDVDETRSMMKDWLKSRGFHVLEARDGKEALDLSKRERPALILMDIGIGPQSGIATASEIRRKRALSKVPIVAVTAYDSPGLRLEAKAAGFNEYVTKPFDPVLLDAVIERLLGQSKGRII